jgi:hypothetical protein
MARAHSRASALSVTPGNRRRSSTAAANSPPWSKAVRIAVAFASETTNISGAWGRRRGRTSDGQRTAADACWRVALARAPTSGLAGVMPWRSTGCWWPNIGARKLLHVSLIVPALLLGAGCSTYDPPVEGDHTSEKYQADVETCRTTSTETVRLKNAATPGRWIISPITGPPAVRAAIRTCMVGKGYVSQKTDD